ncbi:MAG: hypothetical protein AAFR44_11855 [Pseudomonadota bacterium]
MGRLVILSNRIPTGATPSGGLVVALQLEVSRLWEPTLRTELSRLGTALALTIISASVTR